MIHGRFVESRRGVTLLELIIVMAIIGTMVSLLLPAVHLVLQASRRAACDNNFRQLGLAMSGYCDATRGQYPYPPIPDRPFGWAIAILPYMEESNLEFAFDAQASLSAPANLAAAYNVPKMFICPDVERYATGLRGVEASDYWFVVEQTPPDRPRRKIYAQIKHAPEGAKIPWCASPEIPPAESGYPLPHPGAFGF